MPEVIVWLGKGYLAGLRRSFVFRGRSRREAFWAFTLAAVLLSLAASGLDRVLAHAGVHAVGLRHGVRLFHALPTLALLVRRLHDLDHAGWRLFWPPLWGALLWARGTPRPNRFGPGTPQAEEVPGQPVRSGERPARSRRPDAPDAEAVIDAVDAIADRLRPPRWFVPFWFGMVLCVFGSALLIAGIATAPNPNWQVAVALGTLALGVGLVLLRRARASLRRGRVAPSGPASSGGHGRGP